MARSLTLIALNTDLTNSQSPLDKVRQLIEGLPHVAYDESGVKKLKIPLGGLLFDRETAAGKEKVQKAMLQISGGGHGVTFNASLSTAAINISLDLLSGLNTREAQGLLDALEPTVRLAVYLERSRIFLAQAAGIEKKQISRMQYTYKKDLPVIYEFTFPHQRTLKDLFGPNTARQFNSALGENLFESVYVEGGEFEKVVISEANLERLKKNQNTRLLPDILAARVTEFNPERSSSRPKLGERISRFLQLS